MGTESSGGYGGYMVAASSSLLSMAGLILIDFNISIVWSSQARQHPRQAMWLVRSEMELLVFARWMRDMLPIFVFLRLHIHIWGNSNARIGQSLSALYVLSKDKDYVTILVASHFSEFILFFQDVAGAASQRLLSYKYALTNFIFVFRGICLN